jgi:hypothetical protein
MFCLHLRSTAGHFRTLQQTGIFLFASVEFKMCF